MKLDYPPGACSLGSRIVPEDLGLAYQAEFVSLSRQTTRAGADSTRRCARRIPPASISAAGRGCSPIAPAAPRGAARLR